MQWTKGDRCLVPFDEGGFPGTIKRLTTSKAHVYFDDGDNAMVPIGELVILEEADADDEEEFDGKGFNQYPIKWKGTNFTLDVEEGHFYGCWRKTTYWNRSNHVRRAGYAIDMWCSYKGHDYSVESIPYLDVDPREDERSLNSDICAAVNKFLYRRLSGDLPQVEDLRKRAARPLIHISHLETLDRLILRMQEVREVALRSGGQRLIAMEGDLEDEPVLGISLDLTQQALILEGKVPSLLMGAVYDDPGHSRPIKKKPAIENVMALVERLEAKPPKAEARKLRAILRRMGHRGGARTIRKKLESANSQEQGND